MTDVFISYSRRDKVFTQKLVDALQASNREVWADWASIPAASDWDAEIKEGIEKTNTVLFVLSPEWLKSNECRKELEHALKMGKKLLPILHIMPDQGQEVPQELAKINWVYMRESDDFAKAFETLQGAMDTDLDWVKIHTRIQVRAVEWNKRKRDNSLALRGNDLNEGEQFISQGAQKTPEPTPLQGEYILISRKEATRRQRMTLAGVTIALIVSVALGIVAYFQRQAAVAAKAEAILNSQISFARELAASAKNNIASDPEFSTLLSLEAINTLNNTNQPVLQSVEEALRESVQSNRLRYVNEAKYKNDNIYSSAISPNGSILVTGSRNGKVILWKFIEAIAPVESTGYSSSTAYLQPLFQLDEQFDTVYSISFSPDGTKFATSSSSSAIEPAVWDAQTGKKLLSLSGHTQLVRSIVFSPNGKLIATASEDGTIRIWNSTTGDELLIIKDHIHETIEYSDFNYVYDIAFSPDSSALVSGGGDRFVLVSDVETGKIIKSFAAEGIIFTVSFNPDGSAIAWGDDRNLVTTMDLVTNQKKVIKFHSNQVIDITFSPDGKYLASTGSDGKIVVTNRDNAASPLILMRNPSQVVRSNTITYSPDGIYIISGNEDGNLFIWNASQSGNYEIGSIQAYTTPITGLAFSPDGTSIAISGTNDASIWNIQAEVQSKTFPQGNIEDIHFLNDGKSILIGRGWDGASIYSVSNGSEENTVSISDWYVHSSAASPDGKYVATSQQSNVLDVSENAPMVSLWDIGKGVKTQEIMFTNNGVFDVAISPDARYVAAAGEDGTLRILEIGSDAAPRIFDAHKDWARSISFSPDGKRLITGGFDNSAIVWDVESGEKIFVLSYHNEAINDVAFSPDNTMFALGSADGTASIWDTSTGILKFTLSPHAGKVNNIAFSPDNKVIAIGTEDGVVRFYYTNITNVMALAQTRILRLLSDKECQTYLHADACPDTTKLVEISKDDLKAQPIAISTPDSVILMPRSESAKISAEQITRVYYRNDDGSKTGYFAKEGSGSWTENNSDGTFRFAEFTKDSSSITLQKDDGAIITLNIEQKTISIKVPGTNYEIDPLYYIIRVEGDTSASETGSETAAPEASVTVSTSSSGTNETTGLKSGDGSIEVTLKIINKTNKTIKLNWMSFEGKEEAFLELAPGETIEQGTYNTHAWRLRDPANNLLFEFIATEQTVQEFTINADFTVTVK